MAFNPCELSVKMKIVETEDGGAYYIGNCNMDVNLKDTVIKLIEPKEGVRETSLVIKLENKDRRRFRPVSKEEEPEDFDNEE